MASARSAPMSTARRPVVAKKVETENRTPEIRKRPTPVAGATASVPSKRQATALRTVAVPTTRPSLTTPAATTKAPVKKTPGRTPTSAEGPRTPRSIALLLPSEQLKFYKEQLQAEKDKIKSLNEQMAKFKADQAGLNQSISDLEEAKQVLERIAAQREQDLRKEQIDRIALIQEHETERSKLVDRLKSLEAQLEDIRFDNKDLRNKEKQLKEELQNRNAEIKSLQQQIAKSELAAHEIAVVHVRHVADLEKQITALEQAFGFKESKLQMVIEMLQKESEEKQSTIERLIVNIEDDRSQIEKLQEYKRAGEMIRREQHNQIQDLKGNIRVMCRVRPILPSDLQQSSSTSRTPTTPSKSGSSASSRLQKTPTKRSSMSAQKPLTDDEHATPLYLFCPSGDDRTMTVTEPIASSSADLLQCSAGGKSLVPKKHSFQFDRVFDPDSSQAQVFEEISQLVQSACDGYNVCIFAYGQTGSGKTFTMEGPTLPDLESRGMISRTVDQLFATAERLKDFGWKYSFQAQFVEIYKETIRDLLAHEDKKHEIIRDSYGHPIVTDAVVVDVKSPAQVSSLLAQASKRRSVGKTQKNNRSSRSHSVFQMRIIGENGSGPNVLGLLNLVDLAGSERLKASGATGERLKETQSINKSLAALGNVIQAISKNQQHIPFRDSKLTQLLQSSLGGNSKTLMFVNISPCQDDLAESLNSLRFASTVNACTIGPARKNAKTRAY